MPIQITPVETLSEVRQKIKELESRYGYSSEQFAADAKMDREIPGDVAIEWNFLLLQKKALEEISTEGSLQKFYGNRNNGGMKTEDLLATYVKVAA